MRSTLQRLMGEARKRTVDLWVRRTALDVLLVALVLGAQYLVSLRWAGLDFWPSGPAALGRYFALLAQVTATLAGFLVTAAVFFYGMERGLRLQIADQEIGDDIAKAWRTGISTALTGALTFVLLAAQGPAWSRWVGTFVLLLVAFRVARLIKVLFDFIDLYRADRREPSIPTVDVRPRART